MVSTFDRIRTPTRPVPSAPKDMVHSPSTTSNHKVICIALEIMTMSVQNLFTPRTQDPVSKSYVKVGHPAWLMKPTWDCGDPKNGIIYGCALDFIEHSSLTLYDIIWHYNYMAMDYLSIVCSHLLSSEDFCSRCPQHQCWGKALGFCRTSCPSPANQCPSCSWKSNLVDSKVLKKK